VWITLIATPVTSLLQGDIPNHTDAKPVIQISTVAMLR